MARTTKEFIEFYHNYFVPAYSDVVAYLTDKPRQILIELENIAIHLITYIESPQSSIGKDNFDKAYNHLTRVSIDSTKILWVTIKKQIDKLNSNRWYKKYALNLPGSEFERLKDDFFNIARKARKTEIENILERCISICSILS